MQYHVTITIPDTLDSQVRVVDDFDTFVSMITIQALQNIEKDDMHAHLAEAARLMLAEYTEDQELTSFSALDGEPVYE